MENRRDFFKAAGLFFAGLVANKVSAMTPKKEEEKEDMMVSEQLSIMHNGEIYHPVVVKKTTTVVEEASYKSPRSGSLERMRITSDGNVALTNQPNQVLSVYQEPKVRKLK